MNKRDAKVYLSLAAAFVCGMMVLATHGEHGVGWFLLCLFLIW